MEKIIAKNVIKRQKGKLYYIDGKGNACEATMKRGGTKGRRTCSTAVPKKKAKKKTAVKRKSSVKRKAAPRKKAVVRRKSPVKRRKTAKRKSK